MVIQDLKKGTDVLLLGTLLLLRTLLLLGTLLGTLLLLLLQMPG
jgi:hypothetical protein